MPTSVPQMVASLGRAVLGNMKIQRWPSWWGLRYRSEKVVKLKFRLFQNGQPASQPASLWLTQTSRKACQLAASRTEASVGTGWSGSLASGSSWTERGDCFEFSSSVHLGNEAAHEVVVVVVREQVEPLIGDGHRVAVGTRGSSFAGKRICWIPRILLYAEDTDLPMKVAKCWAALLPGGLVIFAR